jgi:nicotinamide phosphoribosyltransferase
LFIPRHPGYFWFCHEGDWEEEGQGELKTVFKDGKIVVDWTLAEIRERVRKNLNE